MLNKSFKSIKFNSENITISKKLDEETRELNKKVRDLKQLSNYLNYTSPPKKDGEMQFYDHS